MHEFLLAEWKTMLAVFVFCSAIFAWFYVDEVQKAEEAAKPYEYQCLDPGERVLDYALGMPLSALNLGDFELQTDPVFGIKKYRRHDGAVVLHFRNDVLVKAEWFPQDMDCGQDFDRLNSFKQVSQPIPYYGEVYELYEGFVRVMPEVNVETKTGGSASASVPLRWMVTPI